MNISYRDAQDSINNNTSFASVTRFETLQTESFTLGNSSTPNRRGKSIPLPVLGITTQ